jgi:hypothetical protein
MDAAILKSFVSGTVISGEPVIDLEQFSLYFVARDEIIPGVLYTNGELVYGELTHKHRDDSQLCIFTTSAGELIPTHESTIRPMLPVKI